MQNMNTNDSTPKQSVGTDLDGRYIKPKDEVTLDSILIDIGQFGKFQILIFLLMCLPMLFNAIFSITYVFTASTVAHRCFVPECDTAESKYNETWINFTIPQKGFSLDQCNRYASTLGENTTTIPPLPSTRESGGDDLVLDTCQTDNFNPNQIQRCPSDNLVFRDSEITISNETPEEDTKQVSKRRAKKQ